MIDETVAENTRRVLAKAHSEGLEPRAAAVTLARQRVERAMSLRRRF